KNWPLITINLKDFFFIIPLQEKDREKFAFTVPTYNNSQPTKRCQWTVLPQDMLNSPALCQYFGFCSCFYRRRKIMDTIKINKGPVRRRKTTLQKEM
ncbi:Endogenous retrovirus group K member 8 Pol protein, partial [Lemmus lemmus]